MKIEKIYHLADIHIRNLQRHKEYRDVFQKFLDNVKTDEIKNSVIYIAGDIAHAKTEMSPELIDQISWFLVECAKLREVIVIAGNHDCNLNNKSRLDVLTPIVKNINNPKIHYLRDTGVYNIHNLNFVVYSILDHKDNWPSADQVEGENKICLFHGPVNKAETDIGYTVSSNSFTADMFDGFDMALLGDIHRRQDLGKGYSHVVYAGSMIQQNHGELLENHGYLLWDVESRTYTEHNIHNEYGYLTVDVVQGEVPKWVYDEIDTKLPKYPRLRLRFTDTNPSDTKLCIAELKRLFNVSEVTVTRTDTIGQLKQNNRVNKNIVGNVKDETFQNQLIKDYLERQFFLEDEEINKITEINKEFNGLVQSKETLENILWLPKKFEFSNMFSYGENNKIDFTKTKGIVGIFAPNASGKSSLFDALSFCLFDKTSRTFVAKNILNNQSDKFYCKFNFSIDGVDYFIERSAKLVRKGTAVKVDVEFWKEDGGIITSLNGEQRRDTNKLIETYIGNFEDFVLTSLSLQGNNALFIDKSQTERKEILSQFIGVDVFDKLYQLAQDENRENSTLIKKFKRDDFTTKLVDIEEQLKQKLIDYNNVDKELKGLTKEEDELNNVIRSLSGQIVDVTGDNVSLDTLHDKLQDSQSKVEKIKERYTSIQERISSKETQQIELEEIIDSYDEEQLSSNVETLNSKREELRDVESKLENLQYQMNTLEERKSHLESHEYNEECEICMKNSQTILEQKEKVYNDIRGTSLTMGNYTKTKKDLESDIKYFQTYEEDWTIFQDAKQKEDKIDRELNQFIRQVSNLEHQEKELLSNIESTEQVIEDWYKNEEQIKENNRVRKELDKVEKDLKTLKQESKKTNKTLLKLNGEVSSLKSNKEQIEERIQEVKDLEEQNKLYDFYLNALGKDGIPYELIEKALPMIEGEVNNILGQIVEFGMQLEMDGKNINAQLVYGNQSWSLEMCSGMERFISGLAIRVALINVCNLPRPNFLVIDEGFGTLDSENLQSLFMLFSYLKTQFDFVMIISHIDSMRDVVDNIVEIKKVEGRSFVKY
jgi:DNA repair exonuclease SbcCD ATPase subunit/DNA repair exonuclease SbcCD nuclease subunit